MSVVTWWPLLIVAWLVAGFVVGLLVGRAIRQRDQHTPSDNNNEENNR